MENSLPLPTPDSGTIHAPEHAARNDEQAPSTPPAVEQPEPGPASAPEPAHPEAEVQPVTPAEESAEPAGETQPEAAIEDVAESPEAIPAIAEESEAVSSETEEHGADATTAEEAADTAEAEMQESSMPATEAAAPPARPLSPAAEELTNLATESRARRLAPADEDRCVTLLKELLSGSRADISSAIEPLIQLPWIIGVNAVSAVWPGLTQPMRRHLLGSLAKIETEAARRIRLSFARAICKIEPPAGLKLAAAVATDLKDPETGALSAKHRQIFFNVFVGKGKPWLMQLQLSELKGADADALIHCAIETFPLCPPLSQLSILRWAQASGRFKKISQRDVEISARSISRWNIKLQRQLRNEIPELPEAIVAVLKPEAGKAAQAPGKQPVEAGAEAAEEPGDAVATEQAPAENREADEAEEGTEEGGEAEAVAAEAPGEPVAEPAEIRRGAPEGQPRKELREQRPERERREERGNHREERAQQPAKDERGRKGFDLRDALRGIDSYVSSLRNELDQTKALLRRREEELKRGAGTSRQREREERPSADVEALIRHNVQLESTVEQLRHQLEDLSSHHEAVAESRLLHTEEPLPEGSSEQLKALLSIKLTDSYQTYLAMREEPLDKVFRLDYRDMLGTVFDVLLHEGIKLAPHQT